MSRQADIQAFQYALKSQGDRRPCNYFDGPLGRQDTYFGYLTQLYYFNQKEFKGLFKKSSLLLKKPANEFGWALRGYFAYLIEDYKDAAASFLEAILLAPENLDNWIDYAFALRHLGRYRSSLKIIFETKEVIQAVLTGPGKSRKARLFKCLKI